MIFPAFGIGFIRYPEHDPGQNDNNDAGRNPYSYWHLHLVTSFFCAV
jgi:hypothetical protein